MWFLPYIFGITLRFTEHDLQAGLVLKLGISYRFTHVSVDTIIGWQVSWGRTGWKQNQFYLIDRYTYEQCCLTMDLYVVTARRTCSERWNLRPDYRTSQKIATKQRNLKLSMRCRAPPASCLLSAVCVHRSLAPQRPRRRWPNSFQLQCGNEEAQDSDRVNARVFPGQGSSDSAYYCLVTWLVVTSYLVFLSARHHLRPWPAYI
jgi:hypothetical protein